MTQKHPSKLKLIHDGSISLMNFPVLRLSTIFLCVKHVTIRDDPLTSLFDESFRELLSERLMRLNHSKDHKLVINSPFITNFFRKLIKKLKTKSSLRHKERLFRS